MLISYASYFVSYLLDNLKDIKNISRIILFGSIARNQEDKDSDMDIFIELNQKDKNFEKVANKMVNNFYNSRESIIFKSKGIDNKINLKIGKLKDWKDLYRSIASDGIILYEHYSAKEKPADSKHCIIIFWDKIGKNRGAFLNKIYGFKINNKRYAGLIEKFSGKKIGKSCILLPIQYKSEIFKLIKDYEVNAKSIEVFL